MSGSIELPRADDHIYTQHRHHLAKIQKSVLNTNGPPIELVVHS